jgi:hypothetical protein
MEYRLTQLKFTALSFTEKEFLKEGLKNLRVLVTKPRLAVCTSKFSIAK